MKRHSSHSASTATRVAKQPPLSVAAFRTPMGWVAAAASPQGLLRLSLPIPSGGQALSAVGAAGIPARRRGADQLAPLARQVRTFLSGKPVTFTVPLDLGESPPFFRAVWQACATIPRGETRTYGWLAAKAGNPRAVRAAGQAMARNPIPLIIPCHRVIGRNGKLTGFGGGIPMKAALLAMERGTT
ncbi:MAG: methylated-DNA--[protein]-cysteine S-methyltransferase [Dehalococcoidia bacterium]|nr:methylated-DNA--[protein]-cysteine S-methyltransferase [Dehalococcoidia bacterium]